MKPIEFIEAIRESIIDSNLRTYKVLFNNTEEEKATDPYWINALKFFNSLNSAQKEVLFLIMRQVEVDTVSKFLSILDGASVLDKQESDFKLTTVSNDVVINGELQDIFLELEDN